MNAPGPGERRSAGRKALRVAAQVHLPGGQVFDVRTVDVGPGGVGIVAPANPPRGLVCRVSWLLPQRPRGARPMALEVQVMHSVLARDEGGFKVGLRFTNLDPESAQAILAFLK